MDQMQSELSAFVCGYITPKTFSYAELLKKLSKVAPGICQVFIPRQSWNGYCFLKFNTEQALLNFLAKSEVTIKGHTLKVSRHVQGRELE